MNINVNIKNKTELVEKLRWDTYKITCMSTSNYRRLQNLAHTGANYPILQNFVSNKS